MIYKKMGPGEKDRQILCDKCGVELQFYYNKFDGDYRKHCKRCPQCTEVYTIRVYKEVDGYV
jgi:hypothetical protein